MRYNMGFKVRGRIKICKGLYVNVGKRGATSVSAKVGGVTINKNRNGRVKATTKVCKGVSYETTLKHGKQPKTKATAKKQTSQKTVLHAQNNIKQTQQEVKPTRSATYLVIFLLVVVAIAVASGEDKVEVETGRMQQIETNEQQIEKDGQQKLGELEEMNELFKNCVYNLVDIEQTTINNAKKYFGGSYDDLEGERAHYIVTLQYDKTREEWANSWLDFDYANYGNSDKFYSLQGMHALNDVSGLYGKPSMEIVVLDINGEIVYKVLNGKWQIIIDSIKSWASQEQLNNMVKGGINNRWCRSWKEFVLNE